MILTKLDICAVRNIKSAIIQPAPTINFFYGANGSGKSAVIEAIFLLGRARSYRTATIKSVVNTNEKFLMVSAQLKQDNGGIGTLGLKMADKSTTIHVNQLDTAKKADLVRVFPLQLIHPKSYELIDAGTQIRREFVDWGVFNSNDAFLPIWRQFKKILAYRNSLLKENAQSHLRLWTDELVNYGTKIAEFRQQYLTKLAPIFRGIYQQFFTTDLIELRVLPGWDETISLSQALANDLHKDLRHGFTHSGPHRGDFQILIHGVLARNYVSRGELKVLVICLALAQTQLLINEGLCTPCILMDDFAAELDLNQRLNVLGCLAKTRCQVFVTAIERAAFGEINEIDNYKMFHVERGNVIPV